MTKQLIQTISLGVFICLLTACLPAVKLDPARQSFREALVQTITQENMTVDTKTSIAESGIVIFSGKNHMERNGAHAYMSGSMTTDGQTTDMEGVWIDGSVIYRIGDDYKSFKSSDAMMHNISKRGPKMADYIIAKLLSDMPGDFAERSGIIAGSVQEDDIPADWNKMMNTMLSSSNERLEKENLSEAGIFEFPIVSNARLLSMTYIFELKNDIVIDTSIALVIAGTDKIGAERILELDYTAVISHIGFTTPASLDTEGKTVIPVKH